MEATERNEISEVKEEVKFNLRRMRSADVFTMVRIIGKVGIGNFKKCFDNSELKDTMAGMSEEEKKSEEFIANVGLTRVLSVVDVIVENVPKCEKDLYAFLADLSGQTAKSVEEAPPAEFLELLFAVVQMPDFADFFKVALRFVNTKQAK